MIVVDASVSLKWFLPEVGTEDALRLLRSGQKLVAPQIIREEVVSGLVRRVRREELAIDEAQRRMQEWLRQLRLETVHTFDDDELLNLAAQIGFEIKHPLFDCLYLATAEKYGLPFVTADKTLHDRAKKDNRNVFLLDDIQTLMAA